MRGQCEICGRFGDAYVPRGGDGSLWVMRPHSCNGFSRATGREARFPLGKQEAAPDA